MLSQDQRNILTGYIYERSVGNTTPMLDYVRQAITTPEHIAQAQVLLRQIENDFLSTRPNHFNQLSGVAMRSFGFCGVLHLFQLFFSACTGVFSTNEEQRTGRAILFFSMFILLTTIRYSLESSRTSAVLIRINRALRSFDSVRPEETPQNTMRRDNSGL